MVVGVIYLGVNDFMGLWCFQVILQGGRGFVFVENRATVLSFKMK